MHDVLALMTENKTSCALAVDSQRRPIGIFTERDAVRLAATGRSLRSQTMASVMSSPLLTISPNKGYNAAYQLMNSKSCRHLVVVDDRQQLVGLVSEGDSLHHLGMECLVEQQLVSEVMSARLFELDAAQSLADAIQLMNRHRLGCVVICQQQKAVGIVTERDVVRMQLQDVEQHSYPLSKLLMRPLITVEQQQNVQQAAVLMTQQGVRRLVVTDAIGQQIGIISRELIAQALQGNYIEHLQHTLEHTSNQLEDTEQKLRTLKHHALFKGLLDELSDAIYIIDANSSRIVDANGQACRNLGYSYEEMLSLNVSDFSLIASNDEDWQQTLHQISQNSTLAESVHRRKDGSLYPAEIKVRYISQDNQSYFLSISRDISERVDSLKQLQASADTYRGVIDTSLDGFLMTDLDGRVLDVNDSYINISGFSRPELLTMNLHQLQAEESIEQSKEHLSNIQQYGGQRYTTQHKRKDGLVYDVETNVTYWPGMGGRLFSFLRDITLRKQNEDRLRQAAAVFENSNEGVIITDPAGTIQLVNSAFTALTGYSREEVVGQNSKILQSGRHDPAFYQQMWQQIERQGSWQGEIWNRRKDGSTYPELLSISSVRDERNNLTHYAGVFSDISQIKESEEKLSYLAHHDTLTGLSNRLMMQAQLQHVINLAEQQQGPTPQAAFMLIDLDRFKDINDSFGHGAGDEVLQYVSKSLRELPYKHCTISRFGGDEFALLIEHVESTHQLDMLACRLIDLLSSSFCLSNNAEVQIGCSVGISLYPEHGRSPEQMLQNADAALFRAKSEGRGRFEYYSEALTREARYRLDMEAQLRHALQDQQLQVYYQPQVDIASGQVVGAEALVRWPHPERGMISPAEFIPLAERTGLIREIGSFVLQQTCQQGKAWLDQGLPPISLAVNVSAHQLRHGDLAAEVMQTLQLTGYPATLLELELTESALMEREEESVTVMQQLRKQGVRLAMDDFGTGYSSLAYLKKFPLDVLKIDKSFVDDIPDDVEGTEIAATIIAMGKALGLKVLAEGVESQQQLAFLEDKACHYYQGFLTSPAIPAEQFRNLLC